MICSDSYGFDLEKLTENEVKLTLGTGFDLDSLPKEGKVSSKNIDFDLNPFYERKGQRGVQRKVLFPP